MPHATRAYTAIATSIDGSKTEVTVLVLALVTPKMLSNGALKAALTEYTKLTKAFPEFAPAIFKTNRNPKRIATKP